MLGDPRSGRKNQPASNDAAWMAAGGILALAVVGALLWGTGAVLDPRVEPPTNNPVSILMDQARGYLPVGGIQVLVFTLGMFLLLGVAAMLMQQWARSTKKRSRVDHLAREMSHATDFDQLGADAATEDALRLGALHAGPGVPLARLVNNGKPLLASWEWVQIWLMGPRAGKTSCVCVPQILETNGPVLATSNKRDIVDMTPRPPRPRGHRLGPRCPGHHR